jgi:hypothetical protein
LSSIIFLNPLSAVINGKPAYRAVAAIKQSPSFALYLLLISMVLLLKGKQALMALLVKLQGLQAMYWNLTTLLLQPMIC